MSIIRLYPGTHELYNVTKHSSRYREFGDNKGETLQGETLQGVKQNPAQLNPLASDALEMGQLCKVDIAILGETFNPGVLNPVAQRHAGAGTAV